MGLKLRITRGCCRSLAKRSAHGTPYPPMNTMVREGG
jgi:hypothetical protein